MSDPTKPPVFRKGQHKPYFKATREQIALRTEAAALLWDCGFSKTAIHRVFQVRYGVEWRQADRYMARARARAATRPESPYVATKRSLSIWCKYAKIM